MLLPSRKGVAWSEEEHVAFLKGLQAFGKGQWKQISRYYVPSRTPTQVASHAQKHFLRVSGVTKRRSRFTAVEESILATTIQPLTDSMQHATHPAPAKTLSSGQHCPSVSGTSGNVNITKETTLFQQQQQQQSASHLSNAYAMTSYPPPPPDENGVALGIPIAPRLHLAPTPTGKLPMLPVQPGRISAPMIYSSPAGNNNTNRNAAVLYHNGDINGAVRKYHSSRIPRTTTQHHPYMQYTTKNTSTTKRHRNTHNNDTTTTHTTIRRTLKMVTRNASGKLPSSHYPHSRSMSSTSTTDSSSACHSALDALAGVAAALADSAGT